MRIDHMSKTKRCDIYFETIYNAYFMSRLHDLSGLFEPPDKRNRFYIQCSQVNDTSFDKNVKLLVIIIEICELH